MPKVSARFRNRKINFRTRISIHKGPIELSDEGEDEDFGYDDSGRQSAIASPRNASQNLVETGVDKEEESELHLQKVINASTAALLRSAVNRQYPTDPNIVSELSNTAANSSEAAIQPSGNQPSQNVPHIPIPDATGLVDPSAYEALYGKSKLFLPSSYIRFSDTVEDTLRAVIYTMDEEDQLWLGSFNSTQTQAIGPINPASNPAAYEESAKARRANARKGKEKERVAPDNEGPGRLSEDDFEALMDHFEKTTEETVPGLHLDINRLPSLADFEHTFESALINPRLPAIKIFAKFVYSHWKERRLKCGGRPIMPAVDFDESNESNPYVCFRRREIKMVRKTRRTDAQNMDRLVRLRNDLYKAHELLSAVLTRERVKREAVELEKVIFEGRCQIRDMKRRLNQPDGDEELLVSKREKRRKKEGSANGLLKSPHRKTTDLDENGPISGETAVQDTDVLKEHVRLSARFMDRELNRIREEQIGWEDFTDSGHQPINLSSAALRWRGTALSDHSPASRLIKEVASGTEQGSAPSISVLTHNQFRRRVGRGGRFLLDRILAPRQRTRDVTQINSRKAPEDSGEDDQRRRFVDRWRYDDDLRNDFPFVDDPQVIDDYDLPYSSRRRNLLDQDDQDCLNPHSETYLSQVLAYLNRVPEPHPPLVKVGKLPSKAVPNLLGSGLGRNHTGSGITTTLQEQILSVQAAAHLQGLGSNHQTTKRILSGVVAAASLGNINGSAQLVGGQSIPRIRCNQSGLEPHAQCISTTAPTANGNGASPHSVSLAHHNLPAQGWLPNSSPATLSAASALASANNIMISGGGLKSANPVPSGGAPLQIPLASPSHIPVASHSSSLLGGTSGSLSRSIQIPANNSPATSGPRLMNGINLSGSLPQSSMLMPQNIRTTTLFASTGPSHQAPIPLISRPGSASSPPAVHQLISRHPSPNMMSIKGSPGARSTKRPLSAMAHHSQPHSVMANHLLSSNSPSPSPPVYNNNALGQATCHQPSSSPLQPASTLSSPMKNNTHSGSTGKTGMNNLHGHHQGTHLVNRGHPSSPLQHPSGSSYNPMFMHQASPGQGVSNSAATAPATGLS